MTSEADGGFAEIDRVMQRRHSCRAFLPGPVAPASIDRMLELSQRAPSWCNTQPWQLWWLSTNAVRSLSETLTAAVKAHEVAGWDIDPPEEYANDHRSRRREAGYRLYESVGIDRFDTAARREQHLENYRFFGAPHVAVLTVDDGLGPYAGIDCGVYLGTLLAVAEGMGIATIAQAATARYAHLLRARFDIPTSSRVVCTVAFGYEDRANPANWFRTSRSPSTETVHRVS